ncbi:SMI1/KNR4 family protein [Pedobacter soli]|uniref:SMI1-KNR4 cell-wall n=1 Tax=Pedobacter soli TaxID=390242 RepID=A0A1G6YGM7_9SPHI|nr:SMI1/KNR4 family protein [Pedobacter soli]SDD89528.1 SMI1-KNR4 cell-wall [Pedobacter soli]
MKEQLIKTKIDFYLKKWVDIELNKLPGQIETEMSDPNQNKQEEWRIWFPIDSKVTASEIEEIEGRIGHKLPNDYKTFLKHKHFYELHISEVSFCRHPVNAWRAKLTEMIFDGYPTEYLIEKGYIPFADWSDWGLLCFDTNRNQADKNYPIVLWDHEIADEVQDQYIDFYDLIIKLDEDERKSTS